jgi:hypothetical protein
LLAGAARRPVPSELRALVAGLETSRALCLIEWPSLTGHDPVPLRCLFTDAYPFPSPNASGGAADASLFDLELRVQLISVVDVYCRGTAVHSG